MQYKHNCPKCKFLGHYFGYDVYLCDKSILARYGNGGPDYCSCRLSTFYPDILNEDLLEYEKACIWALIQKGIETA